MDDIQSWWEVPSIAHFCSLFRAAFNLLDFDIEELEEALLTDGAEDSGSSLLQELIVRLLCGCLGNNDISTFNYQMFLRRLFRQKCQEYGRDNPFNTDIDFQFLPLRTKVEILHALCDFRLDADDVQDLLKNLESDSLRVEPLGHDENNSAYWYFYGTRLYREDYPTERKRIREKKRRLKDEKRKKKRGKSPADSDTDEKSSSVWQVVCFTEEDWDKVTEGFKDSTSKAERALYHTLAEDFLPEIPRLFSEKERLQRKRMMEYQPRRQSSRLEKLKQQKEEEERLQQKENEKQRQEKERKERLQHKDERANRALLRSFSRTTSECGSSSSILESVSEGQAFVGRQTNNSLSSATGQIVIQGLRRKLRGSQVFRQTEEDLQTGMYKVLEHVKAHEDAWPFLEPVDEKYAPRYYSIITRPMDLQQMEEKLDDGEYLSFAEFKADFQLIVDNCRQYNGTDNEYTEMVGNLQEVFQMAVERYLESDPSSDEEVSVEFPKGQMQVALNSSKIQIKKTKNVIDEERENKVPLEDRSLSPSVLSESSSESEKEQESEVQKYKDSESVHEKDSDSASMKDGSENCRPSNYNSSKRKKKTGVIKNTAAIEALELATEQTLKDINKWLDDTPRFSEFSSASNSPSYFVNAGSEECEGSTRTEDLKRSSRSGERLRREQKDGARKRPNKDISKQQRRREVQRTIDRLQPGKSKGNLLSNIQSTNKIAEDGSPAGKPKDGKSSQTTKSDEVTPKLSLGTVLTSDVLAFGVGSSHNFTEKQKLETDKYEYSDDESSKMVVDIKPSLSPISLTEAHPAVIKKIEEDDINIKKEIKEEKQEKVTPNLSAWFKAFGAPKTVPSYKKKPDVSVQESEPGAMQDCHKLRNCEKEVFPVTKPAGVLTSIPPGGKMCEEGRSLHSPQNRCGQEETAASPPQQVASRQRRVSTGSSMSERSSFSQDPMDPLDGSSPRMDNYPAPFPSPLHRSPIAASPKMASPRSEDVSKLSAYQPINGTIRAGFYQDTSSLQKGSPEKNSNNSSPRDQMHPSPYPLYSPRMYPPSDPGGYVSCCGNSPGPPGISVSKSAYGSIPVYSASAMMQYYDTSKPLTDQYRAARTQAAEENASPNVNSMSVVNTFSSSQQHDFEPSVRQVPVSKPPSSVFPVKKRLYSEIEPVCADRLPPPAHASDRAPLEGFAADKLRHSAPLDCARHSPERAHQTSSISLAHGGERFHSNISSLHDSTIMQKNLPLVSGSVVCDNNIALGQDHPEELKTPKTSTPSPPVKLLPTSSPKNTSDDDVQVIDVFSKRRMSPNLLIRQSDSHRPASIQSPKQNQFSMENDSLKHSSTETINKLKESDRKAEEYNSGVERNKKKVLEVTDVCVALQTSSDTKRVGSLEKMQCKPPTSSPVQQNAVSSVRTGDFSFHRGPFSPLSHSSVNIDSSMNLRNSIANLIDRYPGDERLISAIQTSASPFYSDKSITNQHIFNQNISSSPQNTVTSSVYSQTAPCNITMAYTRNNPMIPPITYTQSDISGSLKSTMCIQTTFSHAISDISPTLPQKSSPSLTAQSSFSKSMTSISPTSQSKTVQPMDLQIPFSHRITDVQIPCTSVNVSSGYVRQVADYSVPTEKSVCTDNQPQPKSRKRKSKVAVSNAEAPVANNALGSTAFQQYVGLKNESVMSEPSAIALKTTSVVPGSAFNFGPGPAALGLYTDKDNYAGYLEDFRAASANFYMNASESNRDKIGQNSSTPPTNPFQIFSHTQPRPATYTPLAQAFMNHQPTIVDAGSAPTPLYQPYELLRHSNSPMVLHQGLLPPPSSFPPGYHPALSIRQPFDSVNRPSWL